MIWQLISNELTELKTEINPKGFAKKNNAEVPNAYIRTGTIIIKNYYNRKQLQSVALTL